MDDAEDDTRFAENSYGLNSQQHGYGSSQRPKFPVEDSAYAQPSSNHRYTAQEEDDGDEGEEVGDDDDDEETEVNGVAMVGRDNDNEDDDDDDDDDDDTDELTSNVNGGVSEDDDQQRHPKKRKLKSLISNYEFAPRVPAPSSAPVSSASVRPSGGGRGPLSDWTERETFVLLDEWGNRFLQVGRKSLRSEEWQEVAEKVSQVSKLERTDTQCRNRLDTLKKKYKKEKARLATTREGPSAASKWVYFKKMDMLMCSPSQQSGLSCGMDSGEYVFMNPKVYMSRANGLDEMRDSPGNSESPYGGERDDSDGLPPPKRKENKTKTRYGSSFQLLADSVQKFSEIYEKIESSKRQQMVELEKMRMDFQRDLELQRRQILEKAQAEIAKIRQDDDEENDVSAENVSG